MYNLEQTLQDSTTTVGHGYCGEAHSEQTYESRLPYRCSSLGLTDTALSEHDSHSKSSLYTSRNVSTLTLSPVRNKRISTLTYRSLYDIQEPGYDDEERQQSQSRQEDIEQLWFRAPSSLSSGSDSGSGSGSASVALVTPAESIHSASRFSPVEYQYQKPKRGFFGRKQSDQAENRRPSTFVSKLRTVLLSTNKPASSDYTGKPRKAAPFARLGRRRIQRSGPPQVDARSSSLYPHQTGSISVGGGPYDNLAAYGTGVASSQYASCLSFSDENRISRHHHSFNAFASVADFRHYSTADLPLDPSVPYSPYHAASTYLAPSAVLAVFDKRPSEKEEEVFGSKPDLSLKTDKVRLREKTSTSNWADRSKQFWSSAIDLTLPRAYKKDKAMSTLDLAPISGPSTAPPPVPARSRLRPGPALNTLPTSGSIVSLHQATPSLLPALPASPSGSSIGSSASGSRNGTASLSAASPGGPITPQTPFNPLPRDSDRDGAVDDSNGGRLRNITPPASSRAFGEYVVDGTGDSWPGKLDTGKAGAASPLPSSHPQQQSGKRNRFSRSRHSSSGSVSLSANNDPNRVRDGLEARSSQSGVYTPPSFPGPSPQLPQPANSAPIHSTYPSPSSAAAPGPSRTLSASSFATTASSYLGSFKTSRSPTTTSPAMTTSPTSPSAAANRMYSACVGAFSGLSVNMSNMMSGSATASTAKRSSVPTSETTHPHPYSPSGSGSRSASASYFTIPPRSTSYGSSSIGDSHNPSQLVNGTSAGIQPRSVSDGSGNVQIWSPTEGWTVAGLGLGMDNGTHGTAMQSRSRSNTGSVGVTIGDVPRGKRKPVPKVADSAQAKTEEEQFHAL